MLRTKKKTQNREKASPFNLLLFLFSASYILIGLRLHTRYDCDALKLSLVPCASTLLILLTGVKIPSKPEKSDNIVLWLLAALFTAMLSFADIVRNTVFGITDTMWLQIVIALFMGATVLMCSYYTLTFLYAFFMKPRAESKLSAQPKPYVKCVIFIALSALLFVIMAGYGYPMYDSVGMYDYIQSDPKVWVDWHTISYELFFALCVQLIPGTYFAVMIIVQAILWITVSYYALKSLYDAFKSTNVLIVYTVFSILIISPSYYVPIALKDTVFSMFTYAFSVSVFNLIRKESPEKKDYILLALFASLASLFRHFAVVIVLAVLFALLLYRLIKYQSKKELKKYVAVMLTPIVVYTAITVGIGDGILHKQANPKYVSYTIPVYLAAACADELGEDFGDENAAVLESIMPLEKWTDSYKEDIYWADTVTRYWGGIGNNVNSFDEPFFKGIIRVNASMVTHHPVVYLRALSRITSIVWRIGNPSDCGPLYPSSEDLQSYDAYIPSVAGDILANVIDSSVKNTYVCAVTWRGGFWIFAAVFASFVLIKKKRAELLFMILNVVLFAASLMISVPAQDPRFILSFIEVGIFYTVVALFAGKKQEFKESASLSMEQNEV